MDQYNRKYVLSCVSAFSVLFYKWITVLTHLSWSCNHTVIFTLNLGPMYNIKCEASDTMYVSKTERSLAFSV